VFEQTEILEQARSLEPLCKHFVSWEQGELPGLCWYNSETKIQTEYYKEVGRQDHPHLLVERGRRLFMQAFFALLDLCSHNCQINLQPYCAEPRGASSSQIIMMAKTYSLLSMVGQKKETQLLLWPTEICGMIIRIHYLGKEVMHAKYVPNRTKCNSPSAKQYTLPKAYRLGNLLSTLASLLNTESKQSFSSNRQSLQECGSSSEMISPHPSIIALC